MTILNVLGLVTLVTLVALIVFVGTLVRDLRAFARMRPDLDALEAFRRRSIYRPLAVSAVVAIVVGLLWLGLNVADLIGRMLAS